MLAIRLARFGAKKKPTYRVVVIDKERARNSRSVEVVGHYNPISKPNEVHLDHERIAHWVKNGAQPSDTVARLMKANPAKLPPLAVEVGVFRQMEHERSNGIKTLVEDIAKALVDTPSRCGCESSAGEHATVFELRVAEGDLGKVIGKQGTHCALDSDAAGRGGQQDEPALFARNS